MKKIITAQQYDYALLEEVEKKPRFDDDGFLHVLATPSIVGVMEYQRADGRIIKQLVPSETLDDPRSYRTLEDKPVTLEHPKTSVTPKDAKKHTRGHVKSGVYFEGDALYAPIVVQDNETIDNIMERKMFEVSPGYLCELEEAAPGAMHNGVPYDFIQRNRRYNHLAIVPVARGGARAKIHLDANSENCVKIGYSEFIVETKEEKKMATKVSVQLHDSAVELESDAASQVQRYKDSVEKQVQDAKKSMADMKAQYADMCKEFDAKSSAFEELRGKSDAMKKELADMKKAMEDMKKENNFDSVKLDALVAERNEVVSVAKKVINNFDASGKSNEAIIVETLNSQYNSDGKEERDFSKESADYCRGLFAGLKESTKDQKVQEQADALVKSVKVVQSSSDFRRQMMLEQQGK